MIKIATVQQMRAIEAEADARGLSYAEMMSRAGDAVAQRALSFIASLPALTPAQVTVLVGPGNNGGDGLVAGYRIATQSNAVVRFYLLRRRADDDPVYAPVKDAGLFVAHAEEDQRFRVLTHAVASADIIIDALFGIGIQLPLREESARLLTVVQQALREVEVPPPPAFSRTSLTRSRSSTAESLPSTARAGLTVTPAKSIRMLCRRMRRSPSSRPSPVC
ncbi:MAG: hypothetical protein IPK19_32200 [Chloroflexi bacterium]|nr:hypothetical protein [Chloroflexota bacterium]